MKVYLHKILLPTLFMFSLFLLYRCNFEQNIKTENTVNGINDKMLSIISYLEKNNIKNRNSSFLDFLLKTDTIKLKKYMIINSADSVFFVPGNVPINYINQFFNLKLPGVYTPEGKSFIIFKNKTIYEEFVCFSDDTIYFDFKSNKKLGYSITDSNLFIFKRKFTTGNFECRISDR